MTQNPSLNREKNASLESINAEQLTRRLTVVQGSTIDSCISIVTSPQINTQHFSVGENQMSENYFKAIRSITRHPSFIALPATYRCVLMTILDYMNFKPTKMDDHGMLIELQPGQFMTTYRQLAELANVEKNHVERSLNKFLTMQISRHEVRHKKIIITLCEPYLSEFLKKNGETRSETKVRQTRDTKEEYKEIEEDKSISKDIDIPESGDSGDSEEIIETVVEGNIIYKDRPLQDQKTETQKPKEKKSKSKKPKAIPTNEEKISNGYVLHESCVCLLPKEYEELVKVRGESIAKQFIEILDAYKGSHGKEYLSDYHCMKRGGFVERIWERQQTEKPKFMSVVNKQELKDLMQRVITTYKSENSMIEINENEVQFISIGCHISKVTDSISWQEHGFKDKLKNILRKNNYYKLEQKAI